MGQDRICYTSKNGIAVIGVADGCSESKASDIGGKLLIEGIANYLTEYFEELYMANYSETNETQSWGVIWELKNESIPETASNYKTDIFYFNWNYLNSYDSKKGTCKVQFKSI